MEVAITGAGCVSPLGADLARHRAAVRDGALGVRAAPWGSPIDGWSSWFAAVHPSFTPERWFDERQSRGGSDRFVSYAIAAADGALGQAGYGGVDDHDLPTTRTGVVGGTSMGGFYSLMAAQDALSREGVDAVDPKSMLRVWGNMAASGLATRLGTHGPLLTVTTACASSVDAIGLAADMVASGRVDVALCGGTEGGASPSGPVPATAVAAARIGVEARTDRADTAVLPFDVRRSGIVFGEGAAWFVLEPETHVARRGVTPLAWIRGYGSCADAFHPVAPDPTGRWEAHAMRAALGDHAASDVDLVVAHATGTPKGDAAELRALAEVFPDRPDLLVTSVKGHTGHTGASAGGMGVVSALASLAEGVVDPIRGTRHLDPEVRFDAVIDRPRRAEVRSVLVNAFGFGGQDASLHLTADLA